MAYKLSTKQRAAMFKAFCAKQANSYVARTCKVSHTTVVRYRTVDNWDERWGKIQTRARAKAAATEARTMTAMIRNIGDIRANITKALLRLSDPNIEPDASILDLDRIIRLEQYLKGHPDARTEIVESPLDFLSKMIREHDEKQSNKEPT